MRIFNDKKPSFRSDKPKNSLISNVFFESTVRISKIIIYFEKCSLSDAGLFIAQLILNCVRFIQ